MKFVNLLGFFKIFKNKCDANFFLMFSVPPTKKGWEPRLKNEENIFLSQKSSFIRPKNFKFNTFSEVW